MKKAKVSERQKSNNNSVSKVLDPAETAWNALPWKQIQKQVFKWQKEIYKASADNDISKVRKLQKWLLRSWKARLLAVRKVTQDNRGKKTAGVDGIKSLYPKARFELAQNLKTTGKAKPLRRVWIPKSNGEQRGLGIPTIADRALQALYKMALEPEWEARFEANSYGFRPARRCQDAITQIKYCIQHKAKFVLDADIAKCFDRIDHNKLLHKTGLHGKLRRQVKAWLKSGVMEKDVFTSTESGTPQGGVISPLLANIALHGMEAVAKSCANKGRNAQDALNFIRYADDFVVMHKDKTMILKCKDTLSKWLQDIGLELKPEKTRITHTLETELSEDRAAGFDFLGFHIQQHKVGKHKSSKNTWKQLTGFITLITPTTKSQKNHQKAIGEIIRKHRSQPMKILLSKLNPVIRGWINYYQFSDVTTTGIASKQNRLTEWKMSRWVEKSFNKPAKGYKKLYVKCEHFNQDGKVTLRKNWKDDKSDAQIIKHYETHCSSTEYVKVKGNKSPFDGDLKYWSKRLLTHSELSTRELKLMKRQKGKCAWCGEHFVDGDNWEVDHIIPKSQGGKDKYDNLQLLHSHCHDLKTRIDGSAIKRITRNEKLQDSGRHKQGQRKEYPKDIKPEKTTKTYGITPDKEAPMTRKTY